MRPILILLLTSFFLFATNVAFAKGCDDELPSAFPEKLLGIATDFAYYLYKKEIPWAETDETRTMWRSWAMGTVVVPLRSTGSPIAAIYNPLFNQALFLRFDAQSGDAQYGYYDYGRPDFYDGKPLLILEPVKENFEMVRCRMLNTINDGQEEKFFATHPSAISSLKQSPAMLYVWRGAGEVERAYSKQPLLAKFHDGSVKLSDFENTLADPKKASWLKNNFGNSNIDQFQNSIISYRTDDGVVSAIMYSPFAQKKIMLLVSFPSDKYERWFVDAICFDNCESRK
jgi:hypothetical protein